MFFIKACASSRDTNKDTTTKIIRPLPIRPSPILAQKRSASSSTATLTTGAVDNANNTNNKEQPTQSNSKTPLRVDHKNDCYDLRLAPESLEKHKDSYRILLSLLRRHTTLGCSLFALSNTNTNTNTNANMYANLNTIHTQQNETNHHDYLLHLICESKLVNSSVVGLLVFANPCAPTLRSPRTGFTPLQVALLCNAPLDVVTLLWEFETNKTQFCQDILINDLVPLQILLQPMCNNPCSLRADASRHSLFMQFANEDEHILERTTNESKNVWKDYYKAWKLMDHMGSNGKPSLFHQSFANVLQDKEHTMTTLKNTGLGTIRTRTKNTELAKHNDECSTCSNSEALVEGVANLLQLIEF